MAAQGLSDLTWPRGDARPDRLRGPPDRPDAPVSGPQRLARHRGTEAL